MKNLLLLAITIIAAFLLSCKKTPPVEDSAKIPTVTTTPIINITNTATRCGGNVTSDGGAAISARGVCWNTTPNATTANSITSDGTGTGVFASNVTGLSPATTYYIRAYATNSAGTGYGNQIAFNTTNTPVTLPVLTTDPVSNITHTAASCGGNISSDGGGVITARGICWSMAIAPTIANNKTTDGTGAGTFTSAMTGLSDSTTYYVRAYAINSAGTAYGNQQVFTSGVIPCDSTVTDIDGNVYTVAKIGTQCWMKENLKTSRFNDGTPIGEIEDSLAWANIYSNTLSTAAWCYYNKDSSNNTLFGKLYNWNTINNLRNICPLGWHIPTETEWTTLSNYLGGEVVAGGVMKSLSLWHLPNSGATNSSGFTGLPSGARFYGGDFSSLTVNAYYWSSTQYYFTDRAWYRNLYYDSPTLIRDSGTFGNGFSCRCIRD